MKRFINKTIKCLRSKKGFTLVEVLVSIALLGIVLPLTFELFNLGANLMNRSKQMINTSSEVSYVIDSNRTDGTSGVSANNSGTGITGTGTVIVNYDNITGVNNQTPVTYSSRKKGDVVYYTYTP